MPVDTEVRPVIQVRRNTKTIVVRTIIALLVIGLGIAGYSFWKGLQRFETTDDAQIDGHINAISARISGSVTQVLVGDEQPVKSGDPLVKLDPKDFEIAVAKARADLADAIATAQSSRTDIPIASTTTS